jgi:hypothetical protein
MNIKEFSQPTILTGKQYGTTVTIELDHSDTSIDEVMDGFLTIVKGLGYLDTTINQWIKDKSMDIYEDEYDIMKDSLADDWFNDEGEFGENFRWDTADEQRMDIIGQNGNEGTHYGIATDEDIEECELNEKQLKDYKGVYVEQPTKDEDYEGQFIDWANETPTDEDEFDDYGMRKIPNDKLKAAAQRYSDDVRAKHTPIKLDKTKITKGKIKDLKK